MMLSNKEPPTEQKKQEAPVQQKKKRLSTPLLIFIILMAVTAVLCAIVAGIWLHGRSSLRNGGSAPTVTPGGTEQLDSYTVLHDGKYYRYKEHMVNLLLIGVDSDNKPAAPLPYGSDNQADVILVAALDTDANKMTLISVSRDTMCDIGVPDDTGEISGVAHTQLALSFSNGDGLYESCRLCREAVSQLFYGLQFDGCAAFYMGGIGRLNDAVGGVTVNVLDDYPFTNVPGGWNMYPGQNVTLTGQQARLYIQCRRGDATGNEDRMQRQKQYMLALIGQAKARVASSPASVLPLYNAVSDYVLTDLDLGKLTYLATQAAGMSFSGDMLRVTGQAALGDGNRVELTVDQEALYDLILDVFYDEIPAPAQTGEGPTTPAAQPQGFRTLLGGLRRELAAGVVDGVVLPIDQLADGHHGIAVLMHVLQDGGKGLRRVQGGVVKEHDAPRLQMLRDPLEDGIGIVILPIQTIPIGKGLKAA